MTFESSLQQLAELAGIVSEYHDIWGNRHTASDATRVGLLRAMGIACDNETEIAASLANWRTRHWRQRLAPVQVAPAGQPVRVQLHLPENEMATRLRWTLTLEAEGDANSTLSGDFLPADLPRLESTEIDATPWHALGLDLPAIASTGYHQLQIGDSQLSLILHPPRCHQAFDEKQRVWGLSVQLYGVR